MADQQNLAEWWEDFLAFFMSNSQANISAVDINQQVLDAGYDPADLAGLDHGAIYESACGHPGVLPEYKNSPPPAPTQEAVVRQITQVSEVHNYNTNILDQSTNVDNSVDFEVGGDFRVEGDFDFDNNPVTAAGDGSAASGEGDAAASGGVNLDQSQNLNVELAFGRGGSESSSDDPSVSLLEPSGRVLDPVGGASGLFQPPPTNIINTGSGDQAANTGVNLGGQVGNFGDGAQNAVGNTDSAIANSGNAQEIEEVNQAPGSALGMAGDDLSGSYEDQSQYASTTGDYSPIAQEEGPGDQDQGDTDESEEVSV